MAYAFQRTITLGKASNSDQSNIAVLVKLDSSNVGTTFKTVGNGGHIQNTVTQSGGNPVTMPADFILTSDSGGTIKLPYEVDFYDGANGVLWVWVLMSTLHHSTNDTIYAFYDDVSVTTQQNTGSFSPANVWNSNYKGVWHLPNGSTISYADSTGNSNAGSAIGSPIAAAGQIDGGFTMSGVSGMNITNNLASAPFTYSGWFKAAGGFYGSIWGTGFNGGLEFRVDAGNTLSVLQAQVSNLLTTSATYTSNAWNYGVVTWDGTTLKVYVNNNAPTSVSFSGTFNNNGNMFGNCFNIENFQGTLDEGRQLASALTADWILTEYNNQSNPLTFNTIGSETATSVTTTKTISAVSRIQKVVSQTINAVSRITAKTLKTISGVARITATTKKTETGLSRIQRTSSATETGVTRITIVNDKTISGVSRITSIVNRLITGLSRITGLTLRTETGKGNIKKIVSKTILGVSRTQHKNLVNITGVARIGGVLSMRKNISILTNTTDGSVLETKSKDTNILTTRRQDKNVVL